MSEYQRVAISTLVEDPANARLHSVRNIEAIKGSLSRFGQTKPIVVARDTRVVIAGNGTLRGARELGWTEIDVSWVDFGPTDRAAYAIADNRTAELAEWDEIILAQTIVALREEEGGTALLLDTGFTEDEMRALMDRASTSWGETPRDAASTAGESGQPPRELVSVIVYDLPRRNEIREFIRTALAERYTTAQCEVHGA